MGVAGEGRLVLMTLVAGLLYLADLAGAPAAAQEAPEVGAATSGLRAELLDDLAELERKIIDLARAVPAERYRWRPADGVRSVSEIYMHVAGGNLFIPRTIGFEPPEGSDVDLEQITDKQVVLDTLRRSFAWVRRVVLETPDADLDRQIDLFGRQSTVRRALLLVINHMHEHLGQSIAYARSIGVTPPWSSPQSPQDGD